MLRVGQELYKQDINKLLKEGLCTISVSEAFKLSLCTYFLYWIVVAIINSLVLLLSQCYDYFRIININITSFPGEV